MVARLNGLKESFRIRYADDPLKVLFYTFMAAAAIIMVIGGLITGGDSIRHMLWPDSVASGFDFFEPLRTNMDMNTDIYPPFAYLFYLFLGMLVIPSSGDVSLEGLRNTQMGFLVYSLYLLLVYFLLYKAIKKMKAGTEREKDIFFILLLFTLPSIFLIERANILALVLVFVLLFFNGYDSENKKIRYLSYLCLAFATGFKLYSVIFGLILLRTKKLKEIGICLLIGAAVFFVPFLFTDGTIFQYIGNVTSHAAAMGSIPHADYVDLNNLILCIYAFSESLPPGSLSLILSGVLMIAASISVVFSTNTDRWKPVALIILATLLLTGFKPVYAILFMVVPLIMFIDSRPVMNKLNLVYLICFVLMFIPMFNIFFDLNGDHPVPISLLIESTSLLIMFALLMCETLPNAVRNMFRRIGSFLEGRKGDT